MARSRPNVRIIALLVYALAVNAAVWAASVGARPVGFVGVVCQQGFAASIATEAEQRPPSQRAHTCCDLACAANGQLAPPEATDLALAASMAVDVSGGVQDAVATPTIYRRHARGPPTV